MLETAPPYIDDIPILPTPQKEEINQFEDIFSIPTLPTQPTQSKFGRSDFLNRLK